MSAREIYPRALREHERGLIEFLLAPWEEFDDLRRQIQDLRVVEEYRDGDPSIILSPVDGAHASHIDQGLVAEAHGSDSDGRLIMVFLHVRSGFLWELELVRGDGAPIERFPPPNELQFIDPVAALTVLTHE
jgi:hypothetical protein